MMKELRGMASSAEEYQIGKGALPALKGFHAHAQAA